MLNPFPALYTKLREGKCLIYIGREGDMASLRNQVLFFVAVFLGEVNHLLKRNHLDSHLILELTQQLLCIVRAVKRMTLGVHAGTCMIASDNEVIRAVVSPYDSMPDGLAGASHSHGNRQ
jgi:hypothetical protein